MKNIIITGGELFNKGAQAMTFIAVDEMKRRFPDHRILVLSEMDLERPEEEHRQYAFTLTGWYPLKFAKAQRRPLLRILCLLRSRSEFFAAEEIYRNTDLMIDISGYALGSNWSAATCNRYLDHIEFAKAFGIPMYLMPQSFGPFDFQGEEGRKIDRRIAALLPTVRKICAREEAGVRALRETYHLDQVVFMQDLVLNNRGVDIANIFAEQPKLNVPQIAPNSVAVIPNQRNFAVGEGVSVENLYIAAIERLLSAGHSVYLLSHSAMDQEICERLKDRFAAFPSVHLLKNELNCLEFQEAVKQFCYIVGSRFHAIVHALKNGVPCIAIGWAVKYFDLMKLFNQETYVLDVRKMSGTRQIFDAIEQMEKNHEKESAHIRERVVAVQSDDVFDIIQK